MNKKISDVLGDIISSPWQVELINEEGYSVPMDKDYEILKIEKKDLGSQNYFEMRVEIYVKTK